MPDRLHLLAWTATRKPWPRPAPVMEALSASGRRRLSGRRVVVMPDAFVDILVPLGPWHRARDAMDAVARRGGGNLAVPEVQFHVGGNAANLALGLARLGARVALVARCGPQARALLEACAPPELDLAMLDVVDEEAVTVALETDGANIMLSHPGPAGRAGEELLGPAVAERIEEADMVAVVDWSHNQAGTRLQAAASALAKRAGAFVFVDTGDPTRRPDSGAYLGDAGAWRHVDAWGLNDHELDHFSRAMPMVDRRCAEDPLERARMLARMLEVRIDHHTADHSWTVAPDGRYAHVTHPAGPACRLTGAGDAWNAGNLAGQLLGLDDEDRLGLAHAVAKRHVLGGPQIRA